MKKLIILTSVVVVSLIAFILRYKNQGSYIKSDDELTNGVLTYHHLPENWQFGGNYSFRIGSVKGGGALFASDKDATIVRENKPLFADMEYRPWIRDDVILPDLCSDQVEIKIYLTNHGTLVLEGQAREEFIQWFQMYQNGETNVYDVAPENPVKMRGLISFDSIYIKGLSYVLDFRIIQCDGAYIMVDNFNKAIASFGQESKLYEEVSMAYQE